MTLACGNADFDHFLDALALNSTTIRRKSMQELAQIALYFSSQMPKSDRLRARILKTIQIEGHCRMTAVLRRLQWCKFDSGQAYYAPCYSPDATYQRDRDGPRPTAVGSAAIPRP